MANAIISKNFLLPLLLLISLCTHHLESSAEDEGFISVEITNSGLDFAKNILIDTAVSSLVPLELPQIDKSVEIPVLGTVEMNLSEITLNTIDVSSSAVKTAGSGLVVSVSGATANLSMNWMYSYTTWLLVPIQVSDTGEASVQVGGMEIRLTLGVENRQGSLALFLVENECSVEDISIQLDGGASWLYQGLVDAFEGKLASAVENAVLKKISEGVEKLDSLLQSLPKQVPITSIASLNVTFVGDPLITDSSLSLAIDGLVSARDEGTLLQNYHGALFDLISFKGPDDMITISLHENVIKSALSVYFEAHKMHWIVDKVPDSSLLNTARLRFIIPNLYTQYPNEDVNLNILVSSVPKIKIKKHEIDVMVTADVTINVLIDGEVVPVACVSVEISGAASPEVSSNDLSGYVKLDNLRMSLVWSKFGVVHMNAVQRLAFTLLKSAVVPYVNFRLEQGFSLPSFHNYTFQCSKLFCNDSWITVSGDVITTNQLYLG